LTAQKGKDILLKIDNGSGSFQTIAGLRTKRLALNSDSVDITHSESVGRWRELLAGAGVRKASIAGTGIFKDADSDALMRQLFLMAAFAIGKLSCQLLLSSKPPFKLHLSIIGANIQARSPLIWRLTLQALSTFSRCEGT
jgi:TP901-1 family phage major tail protein